MNAALILICYACGSGIEPVTSDTVDAYIQRVIQARRACGPTCVWYCLRRFEQKADLRELWDQASIEKEQTSLQDVLKLLESRGQTGIALKFDPAHLDRVPVPAILLANESHCVVYEGLEPEGETARYFEPSTGEMRRVTRRGLLKEWSGEAIVFERPPLSRIAFGLVALIGAASVPILWMGWQLRGERTRRRMSSQLK